MLKPTKARGRIGTPISFYDDRKDHIRRSPAKRH
jgi:hypothetical protein